MIAYHPDGSSRLPAFMLESNAAVALAVGLAVSVRINERHAARVADGATYVDCVAPEP